MDKNFQPSAFGHAVAVIVGVGVFMLVRASGALAPGCHAAPQPEPSATNRAQPVAQMYLLFPRRTACSLTRLA